MKQYASSPLSNLTITLGICGVLVGCGGGSAPAGTVQPAAASVSPSTASSSVTAAASETPTASLSSPSPSGLPGDEAANASAQAPITTPPLDATVAPPAPAASAAEQPSAQPLLTVAAGLSISREALFAFNTDFTLPHEAAPAGVPGGYDWYAKPRRGSWNTPPSEFTAITGWGQAFWAKGTTTPSANLLLKNHLTFVCHGSQRQWSLLQSANVEGAVFQPDYSTNTAVKATSAGQLETGSLALTFPATTAYHFWPTAARGALPSGPLCGTLTMVQARAQPLAANSYGTPNLLLGMGADYWLNKTAPWDNYKTNRDLAIGRLKLVTTTWTWYGLSTASNADLERLFSNGFGITY